MGRCSDKRYVVESPVVCCNIDSETFLLVIAGFIMYIAVAHFHNWVVSVCIYTLIPYAIIVSLYILGSVVLFFGVVCSVRTLISGFVWIMVVCLIANVVYAIMICVDQRCLCDSLARMSDGFTFHLAIATVYGFLGFMAGVNFVITLLCVLVVSDYLQSDPYAA